MRISDWSSDVCSSDLADKARGIDEQLGEAAEGVDGERARKDRRLRSEQRDHRDRRRRERDQRRELIEPDLAVAGKGAEHQRDQPAEIGRASWRERVWQYVLIVEVAVALKKQKK